VATKKIYAPNKDYSGSSAGVQFDKGVGELDTKAEGSLAAYNYFQRAGYGIGKPPEPEAPEELDARDWAEPHVVGTPLRDASVDPKPGDFLPPTNAGQANPHGPLVVAPGLHAVGPKPIRPGTVGTAEGSAAANPSNPNQLTPEEAAELAHRDVQHQEREELALTQAVLVEGQPATTVAEGGPHVEDMGPLGLSDPGSVEAGQLAAAAVQAHEQANPPAEPAAADQAPAPAGPEQPSKGASQKAWVEFAVAKGANQDEAQDMTRAQLIEKFGS